MKIKAKMVVEIDAAAIRVGFPYDDQDEEIGDDFPGRSEPRDKYDAGWVTLVIDLATGKVRDWPEGRTASIYPKVRDGGVYELLDSSGVVLKKIESYVPSCLPNDYGDYLALAIDGSGIVSKSGGGEGANRVWSPDAEDIADSFYGEED